MTGGRRRAAARSDDMPEKRSSRLRRWTFSVRAPPLGRCETLCVVGDTPDLGSWAPGAAVPLRPEPDSSDGVWSREYDVPADRDVHYRYCICVLIDSTRNSVRSWETNIIPRKIVRDAEQKVEPDTYGKYDGLEKIQRGWLTCESVLQLKFHNGPFTFKSKLKNSSFGIRLKPVNLQLGCDSDDSPNNTHQDPSGCAITEVATVNLTTDCMFEAQEQYGRLYAEGDFLIFNVISANLDKLAHSVEFYEHNAPGMPDNAPKLIGTTFILPMVLEKSEGSLEMPIMCALNHKTLGSFRCDYLIVRPMPDHLCDMKVSYTNYWSNSWIGLDVGHRGSGSSFKNKESSSIRENTIASLKKAAENGADMLEFDVQLSKDLVPVVYHDFHVCIGLKRKNKMDHNEMLEIPMQDLTLDQMKQVKIFHTVEGKNNEQRFFDEDLIEHQPFPQLSQIFKSLDPNVGFNIEIKGSHPQQDGSMELDHPLDLNLYIDKILDIVLRSGGSRKILFSSFHPGICTMLQLKQNLYPTMFLTQGVTNKWQSYRDWRCNTIPAAINHALNASLLGICVHTEDILRDSTQVKLAIDSGLKIFCWGEDNNNVETIKYLKSLGMHGVIYDKMDEYNTKEVKESIFSKEAREAEKLATKEGSTGGGSSKN